LAAGRGERMRPLTDNTPKPLLTVKGLPLLSSHLNALLAAGHQDVVINTAWLESKITDYYGDHFTAPGDLAHALRVHYSLEGQDFGYALETAGGISRAAPLLDSAFWVVAGDIFVPDFQFADAIFDRFTDSPYLAHLFLVSNPAHNLKGDFGLSDDGLALNLAQADSRPKYTYSSIGLFKQALFHPPYCLISPGNPQGKKAALAPLLREAMDASLVSAEFLGTDWTDVGTPERLAALNTV